MMKTIALVLVALVCSLVSTVSAALAQRTTVLNVDGERVSVYRDEYGVPHIFAETRRALFKAYGYVVAQDRLWQLATAAPRAGGWPTFSDRALTHLTAILTPIGSHAHWATPTLSWRSSSPRS